MKLFSFLVLAFTITLSAAQTPIDWDGYYKLQLSDFLSPATQIGNTNIYSLHSGSSFDFLFYMSSGEFMFTKNFNSRGNCSFKPHAASLVAPDTATAERLQRHVKDVIAPFKYPRRVVFCAALPKTQTGKIQRFRLKQ